MSDDEARIFFDLTRVTEMPLAQDPYWASRLTVGELAYCAALLRADEHLCVRLGAKRAVARALGWPGLPWSDVEIQRDQGRPPRVVLTGALDEWRRLHVFSAPGVSLTHAGTWAAAVAWLPGSP